ncbi:Os07g0559100 [Oryza sativa Japonica Group]|uniref:Os07g0559100 protein n=1 Tax=Oryza sativa subsp. japonica TaxID=39947 RepID=Q0D5I0_ORYSJ|nr:Os07g0559100 [Oryza sativa Japonica Group]|eukprot:NP_001059979.2 Os07g0559100 [Oryza sativa Japonica Group]
MAQLSRVWVAATVAAVRAQRERAPAARERVAGLAPQAAALAAARAAADADGRRQAGADESLRKAILRQLSVGVQDQIRSPELQKFRRSGSGLT